MQSMPPHELADRLLDAIRGADWSLIVFVAGIVLTCLGSLHALGGLDGWILHSSLGPWLRGLVLGAAAASAGGGLLLFWALKVPCESQPARIGLAVASGLAGLLVGHLFVMAFWRTWWLRIFLFGVSLGLAAYVAGIAVLAVREGADVRGVLGRLAEQAVAFDASGRPTGANWMGILRVAAAAAGGGMVYTLLYRYGYPLVWLLRNAGMLAAGVILLVVRPARSALAAWAEGRGEPEAVLEAVRGEPMAAGGIAAGAFVLVGYAMFIQGFAGTFRAFFGSVFKCNRRSFGLPSMIGATISTVFETLGGMLTFKRLDTEPTRLIPGEEEEPDENEAEAPPPKPKKKARSGQ